MPRRSRVNIDNKPALVTRFRVWRIAIYIRLSKEDIDRKDESESVSNQKKMLMCHKVTHKNLIDSHSLF